jgi:hypothetical protein
MHSWREREMDGWMDGWTLPLYEEAAYNKEQA